VARYTYGGSIADYVVSYGDGGALLLAADQAVTFWNAATGGTQYTDLTDMFDTPITSVTSDSAGAIPQFKGPDGIRAMWADAAGGAGPRRLMFDTEIAPNVATLVNDVADLDNAVAALQALADIMPVTVKYDEVEAEWPTRPAIAGSRIVHWHGPVGSPPPSGYMVENDQFFGWAA
jgi:hypothetical protein